MTLKLFEVGRVEDPRRAADQEKRIAPATALAAANATDFDPFMPQAPVGLTGDIRELPQFAPNTCYHCNIHVVVELGWGNEDFYFRTRAADARRGRPKP